MGGKTHLRKTALNHSCREGQRRSLRLGGGGFRIADDGNVVTVFDVEQGARRLFWSPPGILLMKWILFMITGARPTVADGSAPILRATRRSASTRRWAEPHRPTPHELDGLRAGGVEEKTWQPHCLA
jgi:hypothetical protein